MLFTPAGTCTNTLTPFAEHDQVRLTLHDGRVISGVVVRLTYHARPSWQSLHRVSVHPYPPIPVHEIATAEVIESLAEVKQLCLESIVNGVALVSYFGEPYHDYFDANQLPPNLVPGMFFRARIHPASSWQNIFFIDTPGIMEVSHEPAA